MSKSKNSVVLDALEEMPKVPNYIPFAKLFERIYDCGYIEGKQTSGRSIDDEWSPKALMEKYHTLECITARQLENALIQNSHNESLPNEVREISIQAAKYVNETEKIIYKIQKHKEKNP